MSTMKLGPFTKGFNNVDGEVNLPDGSLREAINVDIDRDGWVRRRTGYNIIYNGTNIHSLFDRHFVEDGTLKYLNGNEVGEVIATGIGDKRLSYCYHNSELYYSNEDTHGKVGGEWLVPSVPLLSTVSIGTGSLVAGRYQVSYAYLSDDGLLGPATKPIVYTVPDSSSLLFTSLPQIAGYKIVIYTSSPNGEELYEQWRGTATSRSITAFDKNGQLCRNLNMKQMPTGQIIRSFKGRIWVAWGNTLYYSEAHNPGLINFATNFFVYPERITIVQPTEHGLFICADRTYFLTGTNPKDFQQQFVGELKGIEGTGVSANGKDFNLEFNGLVAYWFSNKGAILGFPNGLIKYISEDRVAAVDADSGVTMYREENGIRQMITNLNRTNPDNTFGASDKATAVVIRNGIVI